MKKSIQLFLRENQFFIHPLIITNSGAVFSEPVFVKEFSSEAKEYGQVILEALSYSKEGDFPHANKNILKPLLKAAKVNSYSTFINGTKCIFIYSNTNSIFFLPAKNKGAKNGFNFLREKLIELPLEANDVIIGETMLRAFEEAE